MTSHFRPAVVLFGALTVICGVLYPLAVTLFLLSVQRAATRAKWTWLDVGCLTSTLVLLTYTYSIGRLLAPDFYTVTFLSGIVAFHDTSGGLLDGDNSGFGGANYTNTFFVTAPATPPAGCRRNCFCSSHDSRRWSMSIC